jgi:LmbE family N-acetylglucosaminyl deacetylase
MSAIESETPTRLLGIWAHPDDEAYLSAGLMARVADAGGAVTVVTATRGEKGTDDPDRYDTDQFGRFRERELQRSLAELGVDDLRFLDLRDGECELLDQSGQRQIVGQLAAIIAEVVPEMIVTFGPDGMTYHPDHRLVSRWVTEAWAERPVGDLMYATVTDRFAEHHRDLHTAIGIFGDQPDGQAPSVPDNRVSFNCRLDDRELDRKRRALAAHGSQTDGLAAAMGEQTYRRWFQEETFRLPTAKELAAARGVVGALR